jgi:hypothetical protein
MRYAYNDGGRKTGGWKGTRAGDCGPRAIAIATEQHYRKVRADLDALAKEMTGGLRTSTNSGTYVSELHRYMIEQGWTLVLTKGQYLSDLPNSGTLLAVLSRHYVAVVNDIVQDTWDSRKSKRTKCGSPKMDGYYLYEGMK